MIYVLIITLAGIGFAKIYDVLAGLPQVSPEIQEAFNTFFDYLRDGLGVFNFFCPIDKITPCLGIFLALYTVLNAYKLLMWVLRKIPFLNIK